MISWRSFTTSKVLPTFVGESIITASESYRRTRASGFDYAGNFVNDGTETSSRSEINSPILTYFAAQEGATGGIYELPDTYFGRPGPGAPYERISEATNDGEAQILSTVVTKNSTIESHYGITRTSPLATIRQETTTTESFERRIRTTKTISADEGEDGGGNTYNDPLMGYVWATTLVDSTNPNGETTQIPSVTQVETRTTETVIDYRTTQFERTILTTTGGDVIFTTYTHPDGDVLVVENTIWESAPNVDGEYNWRLVVTADSPNSAVPLTAFAYAPSRFTISYSEFTETLPVRADSASTIPVTTRQTEKTGHETTRVGYSNDTYKAWFNSFETRTCENRTGFTVYTERDDEGNIVEYTSFDAVNRRVPVSYQNNGQTTFEEPTQVNTTTTTFETFNGGQTTTIYSSRGNTTQTAETGEAAQRNRTYFVANTVSEEITTFQISGQLVKDTWVSWPGLSDKNILPWFSTGDGNRRFYNLPNSETTLVKTTSRLVTFGNSWDIVYDDQNVTQGIVGTKTQKWQNIKAGQFFTKRGVGIQILPDGAATQISADQLDGLASPALTYATGNTHSTVGVFMTANAQHTWEDGNIYGFDMEVGSISRNVVGAVPLYPTFSGLIRRDADGWELCDTSEYTTVRGSRVGSQFSTTIAWQTVEGTSTKNSTSSGEFTMGSTNSADFGVRQGAQTIDGGFQTPNAARTVIVPPGALLTTTYDSANSGSGSTLFSTGTSFTTTPVGLVPITLSSFIQRVQGYGAIELNLLDNGLP
jgi:hypothetical protein